MKNMEVRELIRELLEYNMEADIHVSTGDTFDDISDFELTYGGPSSGDGETKKQTKHVYINLVGNNAECKSEIN